MVNLERLLARLVEYDIEFVIVGDFAAFAHGASVVTFDVELCCRMIPKNLLRLQEALKDLNPVHRMTPQKIQLALTPASCIGLKNIYIQSDWGQLDCLGEVAGVGDYDIVFENRIEVDLGFCRCRVLEIEPLIRAKEAMSRPKDLQAIIQLKAIQEESDL